MFDSTEVLNLRKKHLINIYNWKEKVQKNTGGRRKVQVTKAAFKGLHLCFFIIGGELETQPALKQAVLKHNRVSEVFNSLSTTMQRAPKRRFRGPRNLKVLRRRLKAVEICLHPSHPSVEWVEIFLWSYEIYQGTIGVVLI